MKNLDKMMDLTDTIPSVLKPPTEISTIGLRQLRGEKKGERGKIREMSRAAPFHC
jgi:hypothetical protein